MHTTNTPNANFTHNSDYSGVIYLSALNTDTEEMTTVELTIDDLKSFFASYVRKNKLSEIERLTDDQILNLES